MNKIKTAAVSAAKWTLKAFILTAKMFISSMALALAVIIIAFELYPVIINLAIRIAPDQASAETIREVIVEKSEIDDQQAWAAKRISEAGLKPIEGMVTIWGESRGKQNAFNVNNNGSIDLGPWQINSIHYGKEYKHWQTRETMILTIACVGDYKCATDWAISKRLADGNWSTWYGAKAHGVK
jgi:hypothetical protein